jgi:hypothetical protein
VTGDPAMPQSQAPAERRTGRVRAWLGRIVLMLVAAPALAIGVLAIALSFGPVSLGPLGQMLIGMVSTTIDGARLSALDALLSWSWERGRFMVTLKEPRLRGENGDEIAAADDITVGFSIEALLGGVIALRKIEVTGPTATLVRRTDGVLEVGVRTELREDNRVRSADFDAAAFIDALAEAPAEGQADNFLQEVAFSEATLTFLDEATGSLVKAPRGRISLRRTDKGLLAELDGRVSLPDGDWRFAAIAEHERGSGRVSIGVDLKDIVPSALAQAGDLFLGLRPFAIPGDAKLTMIMDLTGSLAAARLEVEARAGKVLLVPALSLGIPVEDAELVVSYDRETDSLTIGRGAVRSPQLRGELSGTVELVRGADGSVGGVKTDLALKDGMLEFPHLFDKTMPLDEARLTGSASFADEHYRADRLTLRSGEMTVDVSADYTQTPAGPALMLTGKLDKVPAAGLPAFWPKGAAEGARSWIASNISAGTIRNAQVTVAMSPEDFKSALPADEAVWMTFETDDLAFTYMPGMPPLTGVDGKVRVSAWKFDADVASGTSGGVRLGKSRVSIPDMNSRGAPAKIDAALSGSVKDVLALIDHPPLGYASRFGLDPTTAAGSADIALKMDLPLLRDLKAEDIGLDIKATLIGLGLPVADGVKLERGKATLALTQDGMTIKGGGDVSGYPLTIDWTEAFAPKRGVSPTRIVLSGTIDEKLRERFGIDLKPWLTGPVGVSATLDGRSFDPEKLVLEADLARAVIDVKPLGAAKKAGAKGKAKATLKHEGGGYRIEPLTVSFDGLNGEFAIALDAGGKIVSVSAKRLVAGYNDLAFKATGLDRRPKLSFDARQIDLERVLDAALKEGAGDSGALDLDVEGTAQTAFLRKGVRGKDFALSVSLDDGALSGLRLTGQLGNGAIDGGLWPLENGRLISIDSEDAGAMIAAVSGFDSLKGGRMRAQATLPPAGRTGKIGLTLGMADFQLTNQPFFVRLFSAGSLTGLVDLLDGGGIRFDRLFLSGEADGSVVWMRDLRVAGPSVGAQAAGYIDRGRSSMRFNGTLIPLRGVNTILGGIPIIGDILGGENGIFAITFEAQGPLDNPSISVNPLSVLAPGFLREIFEFDTPLDDETSASPRQ